jgi:hypothetical protein
MWEVVNLDFLGASADVDGDVFHSIREFRLKVSPENGTGHRITVDCEILIIIIHLSCEFRLYGVDE